VVEFNPGLCDIAAAGFVAAVTVRTLLELVRPLGFEFERGDAWDWSLYLGGLFMLLLVVAEALTM